MFCFCTYSHVKDVLCNWMVTVEWNGGDLTWQKPWPY